MNKEDNLINQYTPERTAPGQPFSTGEWDSLRDRLDNRLAADTYYLHLIANALVGIGLEVRSASTRLNELEGIDYQLSEIGAYLQKLASNS